MKGVIYTRVSSSRQSDKRQIADLQKHANDNGISIIEMFHDVESGLSDVRPGIQDCLNFCIEQKIDILLIHEVSRLSRNTSFIENFVTTLSEKGVNIRFLNPCMDTLNSDGSKNLASELAIRVLATYANFEIVQVKERLQSGRQEAISKGLFTPGRPNGTGLKDSEIIAKYPKVVKYLKKEYPIREISVLCGLSTKTIQKVKNALAGLEKAKAFKKTELQKHKDIARFVLMGLNDQEIVKLTDKPKELIHSIRNLSL